MIERQAEPLGQFGLNLVHFGTVFSDIFAGFLRCDFGRGAVLVGRAKEQNLVAPRTAVAGVKIGGQLRADEVAEVLDPVDIGKRGSDERACHVRAGPSVKFSWAVSTAPRAKGPEGTRRPLLLFGVWAGRSTPFVEFAQPKVAQSRPCPFEHSAARYKLATTLRNAGDANAQRRIGHTTMKMRKIGKSDLNVSEICLGTMTWGSQDSLENAHAQIAHAKEQGINFMDTAEMYPVNPVRAETVGDTEEIIGKYFAATGDRADWVLATKIAGPSGFISQEGITPATLEARLDLSLKRLQSEYVDLYQLHWPNRGSYHFRQHWTFDPSAQPAKEEILDNMRAVSEKMAELQKAGKVREFGTSNESVWGMTQWQRVAEETGGPRMQSIQNEYSLMCRLYDTDMAEFAVHEGVTLLAYSVLACGMLSGKYHGGTTIDPDSRLAVGGGLGGRVTPQAWPAVEAYMEIAKNHGLDPVAMSIAWSLTRPFDVMPIIGGRSVEQLQHSIDGGTLVLSKEVLAEIDAAHRAHGKPF